MRQNIEIFPPKWSGLPCDHVVLWWRVAIWRKFFMCKKKSHFNLQEVFPCAQERGKNSGTWCMVFSHFWLIKLDMFTYYLKMLNAVTGPSLVHQDLPCGQLVGSAQHWIWILRVWQWIQRRPETCKKMIEIENHRRSDYYCLIFCCWGLCRHKKWSIYQHEPGAGWPAGLPRAEVGAVGRTKIETVAIRLKICMPGTTKWTKTIIDGNLACRFLS